MAAAHGNAPTPDWKHFLHLGEELLKQGSAADQAALIVRTIEGLMGGEVEIWLSHPFYPLPGEPPVRTLPSPDAPELVRKTFEERQPCCQSPQGIAFAPLCMGEAPKKIAVPLIAQKNMLGIIQVERDKPFLPTDLEYLEGLAGYAALSMEVNRQSAIKSWRNGQLSLVSSVSAQIANLPNMDDLCQRITTLIKDTFHYYYVAIYTLEKDGRLKFCACASQPETHDPQSDFAAHLGEGIVGTVGQSGVEIVAPDVRSEPRYRSIDSLPETQSECAIPLIVENRILGVLDVQSDQVDAFHEVDILVLRALADNVALAIEGTRMYDALEHRAGQISAILEVSHALISILDPKQLMEEIVEVIHRRFGYPYVHLFMVHPGRQKIFYRAGSGERSKAYREKNLTYDLDDPNGIIPWVARNGQTLLANDVSKEEHYRASDLPPFETNSELTIPLLFGSEILAVLDIQSDTPNAFDENDKSLLEALAASLAVALRNANLYRSEQWRRQVADSFRSVSMLLSSNIALEDVLEKILTALETNLPCEASAIWLVEEGNHKREPSLTLAASHGVSARQIVRARQRSPQVRAWLDQALQHPAPSIRNPDDPYGPLGTALDLPQEYSSIACPLRIGDRILGILTLAHSTSGRYGSEARDMVETFASYAAVAIQNARLFNEAQEQAWISTVLLQVAEANQSVLTMDDLLANTVRMIALLVGVKKAGVFLWEETQGGFSLAETYGMDDLEKGKVFFEKDIPALARLKATQSTLILHNPEEELKIPSAAVADETGTVLIVPLIARGELLGGLLVAHETSPQPMSMGFGDQTLLILQGIAHQASIAIENSRLVEARQEEAYVTAVLLQVAQAVVSQNNLTDTLDTIVHLMPILVGIDACIIYLWDRSLNAFTPGEAFSGLHSEERELLLRTYGAGDFTLLDEVRKHDTFILCPLSDANLSPALWPSQPCLPPGSLPTAEMSSQGSWLIGVPLSVKGEFYGVMLAKENSSLTSSRERRLEIINGVAQEVALAIQNEQLQQEMVERERMEREVQLAREIQRTFLPSSLPQPKGWEIDARWQTARQVGGDFYDIFRLGDNRLGMVIADVADKGMPAALYMTVTRTLIRASVHHIHSPARVLERVNNLLVPDAQNGMFVTAVFAMLDLTTGVLTYSNAGHNRPLLLRTGSKQVEQLPKGGMALGVLETSALHDELIQIEKGDCLILYTDGVTDTFAPDGQAFGEERLMTVLESVDGQNAQETLDRIDRALTEYRDGEPWADDVTLLAIHRQSN